MQTCKLDCDARPSMCEKLVYTVMQGWEITHKKNNKKNQKIMHYPTDTKGGQNARCKKTY